VAPAARAEAAGDARVDLLAAELGTLRAELAELRRELGELRAQWQSLL
jgi:prefoldin subunit 5